MGTPPQGSSHQLSGIDGYQERDPGLSTGSERIPCVNTDRQHDSDGLCQQTRWHVIEETMQIGTRPLGNLPGDGDAYLSHTPTRDS